MNLTNIPLDELPRWSPWPQRLLGLETYAKRDRTIESVAREYNAEKYPPLLSAWRSGEATSPEELKELQIGTHVDNPTMCVSIGDTLCEMDVKAVFDRFQQLLYSVLAPEMEHTDVVIELGCGYGYNLWRLSRSVEDVRFVGGELSAVAVELAQELFADNDRLEVERFNFFDERYDLLDVKDERVVVFTAHSIEQLPDAAKVIRTLVSQKANIRTVYHFEPVMELYGESLLGLMRRRYTKLNDYNQNLLSELKSNRRIEIKSVQGNVLGINPLNPTSIIAWRPL